jgi:hypothetical protein
MLSLLLDGVFPLLGTRTGDAHRNASLDRYLVFSPANVTFPTKASSPVGSRLALALACLRSQTSKASFWESPLHIGDGMNNVHRYIGPVLKKLGTYVANRRNL